MNNTSFYSEEELSLLGFSLIGKNALISRFARFYNIQQINIGDNVRIDDFCILSGKINIGNYVHVSAFCAYYGGAGITIGDFSGTSPRCTIFSVSDDFSGDYMVGAQIRNELRNVTEAPVTIGKYSQIGAGTVVLPGVMIGDGVAVGAMSLVTKSLDAWGIYAGIPAMKIKNRSKGLLSLIRKT